MASNGNNKVVAIVDDDAAVRVALEGLLRSAGLTARAFQSAEEFIKSGQQFHTACLIADIRMPGMSGLELQAKLNSENRDLTDMMKQGDFRTDWRTLINHVAL